MFVPNHGNRVPTYSESSDFRDGGGVDRPVGDSLDGGEPSEASWLEISYASSTRENCLEMETVF